MHMLHDVRVHFALGGQIDQDALKQQFFASGDNVTWLVLALNSAVFRVLIRPYFSLLFCSYKALLSVEDDSFWSDLPTVLFENVLPQLDDNVACVGYPMGGDNVCVTRGVVSRIDLLDYTFSNLGDPELLVIQIGNFLPFSH
jgi:hypothetical protein